MKWIYKKEIHPDGYFWKLLCIVYDNESQGFLERLLTSNGIEFKTEIINHESSRDATGLGGAVPSDSKK